MAKKKAAVKRTAIEILSEMAPIIHLAFGETRFGISNSNTDAKEESRKFFILRALFDELYDYKPDFLATIGRNAFDNRIKLFFTSRPEMNSLLSQAEARHFIDSIIAIPIVEIRVFAEVSGVQVNSLDPVVLGPFTVYDAVTHREQLIAQTYNSDLNLLEDKGAILLQVSVSVRDPSFASEIAEPLFSKFERTVSFMMNNRTAGSSARVLSMAQVPLLVTYAFSPDGSYFKGRKRSDAGISPDLADKYFVDPRCGHDHVWNLLQSSSSSNVSKRILITIDWIGQSLLDKSPANRLLKAAIALESLFSLSQDYISKGLTAQLSECVAQVMGDDIPSRAAIEQEIKTLYGVRSAVVHGSGATSDMRDANKLVYYAAECVHRFLTCRELTVLNTEEDLRSYFNSLRFGGPTLFGK